MTYLLDLGVIARDTITVFVNMPFNGQALEHDELGYIASGNSQGELVISSARKDSVSRTIKVEVNDES
ncbi:hypothetical protein [Aliivibrio sp. 1S128]|uniref:hypothetical protein n=1 Tax=Aliivibrio sp. 1S128 TaxID=1840085 RepID=UPI00080E324C|nr:hypothetical protein [Aliivibrio sp. 1S128]OCH12520.1 hypothetical protein A6E03_03565 [Aliivibrio sp. 1S128]